MTKYIYKVGDVGGHRIIPTVIEGDILLRNTASLKNYIDDIVAYDNKYDNKHSLYGLDTKLSLKHLELISGFHNTDIIICSSPTTRIKVASSEVNWIKAPTKNFRLVGDLTELREEYFDDFWIKFRFNGFDLAVSKKSPRLKFLE